MLPTLPPEFLAIVPELATMRWSDETAASCGSCPMQRASPGAHGNLRVFEAKQKCCTYHPRLANYAVGRILRRGDQGARLMLKRLQNLDGVSAGGVGPDQASARLYDERSNEGFGNMALVCPYWVEATGGCGVHADRNSVCRTWFCKHVDGASGWLVWHEAKAVLQWVEDQLMEAAIAYGEPPAAGADRDAWIAWFLWCAAWVDEQGVGWVKRIGRDAVMERRLQRLRAAMNEREATLPDVVAAHVCDWQVLDDVVRMTGYSRYDTHDLPRHVFALFSKLDGTRGWREALALAEAEIGAPIGEELVQLLWRQGIVSAPVAGDFGPAGARIRVLEPEEV